MLKNNIPEYINLIAGDLSKHGNKTYLVGGAIRDLIMERTPKDYDLATDALPEEIIKIFPKAIATGIKFGTITVLYTDTKGESRAVEITTLRAEEDYVHGRWPSKVEFTKEIATDLSRRDFTINAIALELPINENANLVDLYGGLNDIRKKTIRAVRDPHERFSEDGVRTFKACRMASTLEFEIEPKTFNVIPELLAVSAQVSKERIRDEFLKLIYDSPKPSTGIELLRKSGLLSLFIPELLEGVGVEGGPYHNLTIYEHLLKAVDLAPDRVKLAALFHDIAKPRCADGKGHFYGHAELGAEMTRVIMRRLKFPNYEIDRVSKLVRSHMFYYPYEDEDEKSISILKKLIANNKLSSKKKSELVKRVEKLKKKRNVAFHKGWSDKAIRRFIRNLGGVDDVDELLELRVADALANPITSFDPSEIQAFETRVSEVIEKDLVLTTNDLQITGEDIKKLGVTEGPEIGRILAYLLNEVEANPSLNTKSELIKLTEKLLKKK